MIRMFDESDGVTRSINLNRPEEEKQILKELTQAWPPKVDGYLFINQEEVDAVIALREKLKHIENDCNWASLNVKDTRTLLCFARARRLNVKNATAMFLESYEWRKIVQPEQIASGFVLPKVVDLYGTGGPFGHDKDGSPVFFDRLGKIDPAGILKHVSMDELLDCEITKLEYLQALTDSCLIRDRKLHWGCTIIMDLDGLGRHHLNRKGLDVLKHILHQSDHNYPERAKRVLVINAPYIFKIIWVIVELFLDPVTREKIQIYNNGAVDVLLKYIDADQLPQCYGGTATNGKKEPLCDPPIRNGGKVPHNFEEEFKDARTE